MSSEYLNLSWKLNKLTCVRFTLTLVLWGILMGFIFQSGFEVNSENDETYIASSNCYNKNTSDQLMSKCLPQSLYNQGCTNQEVFSMKEDTGFFTFLLFVLALTFQSVGLFSVSFLVFVTSSHLATVFIYTGPYYFLKKMENIELCTPWVLNEFLFKVTSQDVSSNGCQISLYNRTELLWAKDIVTQCSNTFMETTSSSAVLKLKWMSSLQVQNERGHFDARLNAMMLSVLLITISSWFLQPIDVYKYVFNKVRRMCSRQHQYEEFNNSELTEITMATDVVYEKVNCSCCVFKILADQHIFPQSIVPIISSYLIVDYNHRNLRFL